MWNAGHGRITHLLVFFSYLHNYSSHFSTSSPSTTEQMQFTKRIRAVCCLLRWKKRAQERCLHGCISQGFEMNCTSPIKTYARNHLHRKGNRRKKGRKEREHKFQCSQLHFCFSISSCVSIKKYFVILERDAKMGSFLSTISEWQYEYWISELDCSR